eukprot:2106741-Alexandrium_andersonii.AAC.1
MHHRRPARFGEVGRGEGSGSEWASGQTGCRQATRARRARAESACWERPFAVTGSSYHENVWVAGALNRALRHLAAK